MFEIQIKRKDENIITDIEGNVYQIIKIGSQTWMTENLRTTKFRDGRSIPLVTDKSWSKLSSPGYCLYNNITPYKATYGLLYNWYTVSTSKLCPTGWHVPNNTEWTILTDYLGGSNVAGAKLKEKGYDHWIIPNIGATNESRFNALPSGFRGDDNQFYTIGQNGFWWSTTENEAYKASEANAYRLGVGYYGSMVYSDVTNKRWGISVRCLRDF